MIFLSQVFNLQIKQMIYAYKYQSFLESHIIIMGRSSASYTGGDTTKVPRHSTLKKTLRKISTKASEVRKMALKKVKQGRSQSDKVGGLETNSKKVPHLLPKLMEKLSEEQLNCPICLELCIYPVNTQCGHYYCLPCFEQFHKNSQRCCICREDIDTIVYGVSSFLKQTFENFVDRHLDWAQAEIYWNRVRQFERIEAKRGPSSQFLVGDYIDIYFRGKWRQGKIFGMFKDLFYIEILSFVDPKYNETIQFPKCSRLIVKHQTFTFKISKKKEDCKVIKNVLVQRVPINQQRQEPPQLIWTQHELQELQNGGIRLPSWDQNMTPVAQFNLNQQIFGEGDNNFLREISDTFEQDSAENEEMNSFLILN